MIRPLSVGDKTVLQPPKCYDATPQMPLASHSSSRTTVCFESIQILFQVESHLVRHALHARWQRCRDM